jgi:release factor glutamine methyltransferase
VVASNPPYIPSGELPSLPPEVRREPRLALDGGADGLDTIRRLVADARPLLRDGGSLILEVGAGQAPAVAALMRAANYQSPSVTRDLAGIERVVAAKSGG